MKFAVVVVCLSACGGTQANQRIDTREKFVAWHQEEMKTKLAKCNKGDKEACASYAFDLISRFTPKEHPDWVDETYPLDPVKAKAILYPICTSPLDATSHGAVCDRMVESVAIDLKEADALCMFQDCAHVGKVIKLDDKSLRDLCTSNTSACIPVLARIQDPALKTDVAVVAELGEVLAIAVQRAQDARLAAQSKADDDDDDDESPGGASDANRCHKDTDCKGDRICDKGSCVDAKPAASAKPAAPKHPAVVFKNDMCTDAAKYAEHLMACPAFDKDIDSIHDHLVKASQLEPAAAHPIEVAVGCARAEVALKVAASDLCDKPAK